MKIQRRWQKIPINFREGYLNQFPHLQQRRKFCTSYEVKVNKLAIFDLPPMKILRQSLQPANHVSKTCFYKKLELQKRKEEKI